jgi:hypothetical protein
MTMAIEITPGAENVIESLERPAEVQFDPNFVDHDPAEGEPHGGGGLAW